MKHGIRFFLLAILLTLPSGCAGLKTEKEVDPLEGDPIARAARDSVMELSAADSENEILRRNEASYQYRLQIRQALNEGEIVLGMGKDDVFSIWGHPHEVETAGDPTLENERWIYQSNPLGTRLTHSSRVVYFESGHVVGWEKSPESL